MKYYIIAGEASGDLHGSNLIKSLKQKDPSATVRCWGGELMEAAGATLVKHYRDLAFMGFVEVLRNLRTIFRNLDACKKDVLEFKPDALILIDYPGFNLRIAEWAHEQGFKVIYYISPQVWAWKENRVKQIRRCVNKMLVILPFEQDFYEKKWDYKVEYVGHPLVEVVNESLAAPAHEPLALKPIIALLPGSRKQEILKKLPVMLEVSRKFPDHQFIVAMAPGQEDAFYEAMLQPYDNVSTVRNRTYELLRQSEAALVTSGTATLETALFGVPEVVCYKGSSISYWIARKLIKVRFISLVNLIMDKEVVKELIQNEMDVPHCTVELHKLLEDQAHRSKILRDYADLKQLLSEGGNASDKAATSIAVFLGLPVTVK